MKPISRKEEEILAILYRLEKALVREIIAEIPGPPKPAYNTVSTVVRRLVDKGYVGYEDFGTVHRYYPLIPLSEFQSRGASRLVDRFFGHSYKAVVAHFAREQKLSKADLEDIIRMIEEE